MCGAPPLDSRWYPFSLVGSSRRGHTALLAWLASFCTDKVRMIFRAWAVRSGPKSTEVRTTRQTVNVGMTSSLFGAEWRKYSRRLLSRSGRYCPLKDKNPARPNHADFMACDYNIELYLSMHDKKTMGMAGLP